MTGPSLKQRLLKQPTRRYAPELPSEEPTPYWAQSRQRVHQRIIAEELEMLGDSSSTISGARSSSFRTASVRSSSTATASRDMPGSLGRSSASATLPSSAPRPHSPSVLSSSSTVSGSKPVAIPTRSQPLPVAHVEGSRAHSLTSKSLPSRPSPLSRRDTNESERDAYSDSESTRESIYFTPVTTPNELEDAHLTADTLFPTIVPAKVSTGSSMTSVSGTSTPSAFSSLLSSSRYTADSDKFTTFSWPSTSDVTAASAFTSPPTSEYGAKSRSQSRSRPNSQSPDSERPLPPITGRSSSSLARPSPSLPSANLPTTLPVGQKSIQTSVSARASSSRIQPDSWAPDGRWLPPQGASSSGWSSAPNSAPPSERSAGSGSARRMTTPYIHPDTGLPIVRTGSSQSGKLDDRLSRRYTASTITPPMPIPVPGSGLTPASLMRKSLTISEPHPESRQPQLDPIQRKHQRSMSANTLPPPLREKMTFIREEPADVAVEQHAESPGSGSGDSNLSMSGGSSDQSTILSRSKSLHTSSAVPSRSYLHPNPPVRSKSVTASSRTTIDRGSIHSVSTTTYNEYQTAGRKVLLPNPLPSSYGSSAGEGPYNAYGSLTLARAAYIPSRDANRVSSKIDITRSGLAQTSMATIEIVRGAAAEVSHLATGHASLTHLPSFSLKRSKSRKESPTPAHLRRGVPLPLAFSARSPPPSKLPSTGVLVQVFMVGLDGLDSLVVRDKSGLSVSDKAKAKGANFGFIPGRSFVGRAVEVGYEVRNVCKSDWVFGLLDLAKMGALAEFIIVDRRRVHRAPQIAHGPGKAALSLEQVALLPLCGVPAHRALRSLVGLGVHDDDGKKTALVFNAHDGIGALLVQMLTAQSVIVTAQVPAHDPGTPRRASEPAAEEDDHESDEGTNLQDRARLFGAQAVVVGDPLVVLAEMSESVYDYVLDTVGGKRVWDASRWVLKTGGQFTTLVGDEVETPAYATSDLRSNLRAIRGAMSRSDSTKLGSGKGGLRYEWIMPNADLDTEGEDVRDALAAVTTLAENGVVAPWPKWAVPFEQTPEAFVESRGLFKNGGVVVTKIAG